MDRSNIQDATHRTSDVCNVGARGLGVAVGSLVMTVRVTDSDCIPWRRPLAAFHLFPADDGSFCHTRRSHSSIHNTTSNPAISMSSMPTSRSSPKRSLCPISDTVLVHRTLRSFWNVWWPQNVPKTAPQPQTPAPQSTGQGNRTKPSQRARVTRHKSTPVIRGGASGAGNPRKTFPTCHPDRIPARWGLCRRCHRARLRGEGSGASSPRKTFPTFPSDRIPARWALLRRYRRASALRPTSSSPTREPCPLRQGRRMRRAVRRRLRLPAGAARRESVPGVSSGLAHGVMQRTGARQTVSCPTSHHLCLAAAYFVLRLALCKKGLNFALYRCAISQAYLFSSGEDAISHFKGGRITTDGLYHTQMLLNRTT